MTTAVMVSYDNDKIATMIWDVPGQKVNVFDEQSIADFEDAVRSVLADLGGDDPAVLLREALQRLARA